MKRHQHPDSIPCVFQNYPPTWEEIEPSQYLGMLFTTSDLHGVIISWVNMNSPISNVPIDQRFLSSLERINGMNIRELIIPADRHTFEKHIADVIQLQDEQSTITSEVYRFEICSNEYVFMKTKSGLHSISNTRFMISMHEILMKCEPSDLKDKVHAAALYYDRIHELENGEKIFFRHRKINKNKE